MSRTNARAPVTISRLGGMRIKGECFYFDAKE